MKNGFMAVLIIPMLLLSGALNAQDSNYTKDFIDATQIQDPAKRVSAFEAYVAKYPDTSSQFTRNAYYWIAASYSGIPNYEKAVAAGKKALQFKDQYESSQLCRLYYLMAEAYAIKSSPVFNKDESLKYFNLSIEQAKKCDDQQVLKNALEKKEKLTTPPPPSETPEQKLKRVVYGESDYAEGISVYNGLNATQKEDLDNQKAYATSLFKANRHDQAVKFIPGLLSREKNAQFAFYLAKSYEILAKRNRALYQQAAENFALASNLYQADNNSSNAKTSKAYANNALVAKYDLQRRIDAFNAKSSKGQQNASANADRIRRLEYQIRKENRRIERKYADMGIEPPEYEYKNVRKMTSELENLRNGGGSADSGSIAEKEALEREMAKVSKELSELMARMK